MQPKATSKAGDLDGGVNGGCSGCGKARVSVVRAAKLHGVPCTTLQDQYQEEFAMERNQDQNLNST